MASTEGSLWTFLDPLGTLSFLEIVVEARWWWTTRWKRIPRTPLQQPLALDFWRAMWDIKNGRIHDSGTEQISRFIDYAGTKWDDHLSMTGFHGFFLHTSTKD